MVPKLCADGPPPRRPALDWQWQAMDAAGAEPGIGRRRRARAPSAQSCGDNSGMEPVPPGGLRDIVLLGSTGSIGTQAADIVRRNPDRFRLTALAAGGGKPALLASQALEFGVQVIAVASEAAVPDVRAALQALVASGDGSSAGTGGATGTGIGTAGATGA